MMKILRADTMDLERILPLFGAYLRFYRQPFNRRNARSFLAARLRRQENAIFLAVDRNVALGFTQLYPTFASLTQGRAWILHDLYVVPAARRRGVGEALLRRAEVYARRSGAHSLNLETAVTNRPAQRLYEKLGWRRDTKFHRYLLDLAPVRRRGQ
jgi:ribosomal protein S18 acetylase RimI-like enzyme